MLNFIVGVSNSGTTLLSQLVNSHPDINIIIDSGSGVLQESLMDNAEDSLGLYNPDNVEQEWLHGRSRYPYTVSDDIAVNYRNRFPYKNSFIKRNKLIHNKPLLDQVFPESKKLIILRDGRSQVIAKGSWAKKGLVGLQERSKFLNCIIDTYEKYWHNQPDVMAIRYETLCAYPRDVMKKVFEFWNLNQISVPEVFKNMNYKWHSFQHQEYVDVEYYNNKLQELLPC